MIKSHSESVDSGNDVCSAADECLALAVICPFDMLQAASKKQQLAFEGYCCLPELQYKQWYWIEKGRQNGPYSIADLFRMAQGKTSPKQRARDIMHVHASYMDCIALIWQRECRKCMGACQSVECVLNAHAHANAAHVGVCVCMCVRVWHLLIRNQHLVTPMKLLCCESLKYEEETTWVRC